ncbi:MAG: SDR family NAD(P)-dependent oxidoreductase [Planctomycetota bacterium]
MAKVPEEAVNLPRRVLVTGGAGFIGSHLVDHLLARGHRVLALDDLSTGSLDNLRLAMRSNRFRFARGSAEDRGLVERELGRCDLVFHLAGAVGVRRCADAPVSMIERNLGPTRVVLDVAARMGVPVLIASSSEVYGDGPVPFRESEPIRLGPTDLPRGGYACAKAMGEWLALAHASERGLPVVIARLFNTVGERQSGRYGMVLPTFVRQAVSGAPITVYGDGSQTRCFAAVGEVVRALAEILPRREAHGRVFNVGSGIEVSILEVARIVKRLAGSQSPIRHVPLENAFPPGLVDPRRRVPSLDRLRSVLGWVPETPIERIAEELLRSPARGRIGAAQVAAG